MVISNILKQCPTVFRGIILESYLVDLNLNQNEKIRKWKIAERIESAVLIFLTHPYIYLNKSSFCDWKTLLNVKKVTWVMLPYAKVAKGNIWMKQVV